MRVSDGQVACQVCFTTIRPMSPETGSNILPHQWPWLGSESEWINEWVSNDQGLAAVKGTLLQITHKQVTKKQSNTKCAISTWQVYMAQGIGLLYIINTN